MFDTSTCEEFRQYDDDKHIPCYAATHYGLRDADAYPRNKGEFLIYPFGKREETSLAIQNTIDSATSSRLLILSKRERILTHIKINIQIYGEQSRF